MKELLQRIAEKKKLFDSYKPFPKELEKNLYNWTHISLTYTSNAIEGNTLSHQETALIIEKNIAIGGKSLTEHQETKNHAKAIDLITQKAKEKTLKEITNQDILDIHRCILSSIDDANAGVFSTCSVRIGGSEVPRQNYLKVPELMDNFIKWLTTISENLILVAAQAHLKLVFIHPFVDGNGRTARLLMNLILLQDGYPLFQIAKENRINYLNAIEKALSENNTEDFYRVIGTEVEKALDIYLDALKQSKTK